MQREKPYRVERTNSYYSYNIATMSPPSAPVSINSTSNSTDRVLGASSLKTKGKRSDDEMDTSASDQQQQQIATTNNTCNDLAAVATPTDAFSMNNLHSSSLLMGGGMYGGTGMGMYGSYGMYNPMMSGMGMGMGPLNSLNQLLFSVQTVVFSLGQAVQIIGMNTQAIKQLFESITAMFDHAVATIQEMQALERRRVLTDEEKRRQRRLRALRWTLATAVTYAVYRLVRRWTSSRRQPQRIQQGNYPSSLQGYDNALASGASNTPYTSHNMNPYSSAAMSPYQPYRQSHTGEYGALYGSSSGYGGHNSRGGYY